MRWFVAVGLLSCQDGEAVVMRWSFGASALTCQEAGVATVHVHVGPLSPSGSYDHEVRCSVGEGEGVTLLGVAPGRHTLVLKALSADRILYDLRQNIDVPAGGDLGTFVLAPYEMP